ncbi:CGNR zinc finger domain-containing protein [Streptomyces olivaceoviridis]|uniref:CGNR zinc finger domain-containing protein n=1 Tax=Streptomyces olivaceoviridis TaxID=1921 RepID=UPI00367CCC63
MNRPGSIVFRQGAGRLSLDFLRTLRYRGDAGEVEELRTPEELLAWAEQCCACVPAAASRPVRQEDVNRAREAREVLYGLLAGRLDGTGPVPVPADVRARLNAWASAPPPVPHLDAAGRLRWQAGDVAGAVLSLVARDALDLVTSPAMERVRRCAGPRCGALFLDNSRPGSRRWCSMGACGNHEKKRARRERTVPASG